MIRTEPIPSCAGHHTPRPEPRACRGVEPDLVERIAIAMREMEACGRPVMPEALCQWGGFTRAEIREHGEAAADRATLMAREQRQ